MSIISKKRKRLKANTDLDDNQGKLKSFSSIVVKSDNLKDKLEKNTDTELKNRSSKLLENFDFDQKFGPCSELTRGQRLERAKKLGISVDINIENEIKNNYHSKSTIDKLMTLYID